MWVNVPALAILRFQITDLRSLSDKYQGAVWKDQMCGDQVLHSAGGFSLTDVDLGKMGTKTSVGEQRSLSSRGGPLRHLGHAPDPGTELVPGYIWYHLRTPRNNHLFRNG